ncbi:MAG: tetratricopeptide repeat protein [Vicinamibacterales bacterium]
MRRLFASPWIEIVLSALVAIVYLPVRHFQFVNWDDPTYITENKNILEGLTWHSVRWALTTAHSPYWHPITWLSHLADVQWFGLAPGPPHLTNLAFHAANTLLVFWVVRNMTRANGASAFVAAVFAVHPLHVESVAWVTERKDLVSTFFVLLAIAAYVAYVRRGTVWRYVGVAVLYALALMSKPMVVTLPALLLVLDVWPLRRIAWPPLARGVAVRLVLEKAPLFVMAAVVAIVTFIIQKNVGAVPGVSLLPLGFRVRNALVSYVGYVGSAILPVGLAAFYPMHEISWAAAIVDAVVLAGVTAAAARRLRQQPYLLAGWLWFVIAVLPVIGLTQAGEQARADRFMYLPLLGLAIVVSWSAAELRAPRIRRVVLPATAVLAIGALAAAASTQVGYWSDSVTLWTRVLAVTSDNYLAYEDLGGALRDRGDLEGARRAYLQALALSSTRPSGFHAIICNDLGLLAAREGDATEATTRFLEAVRTDPSFAQAHNNLANTLAAERQFDQANDQFKTALALDPEIAEAHVGLGNILLQKEEPREAEENYREAIELDPDLPEAHEGLGGALALEGEDAAAAAEYSRAIELKPDLRMSYFNMAVLLIRKSRTAEAVPYLERALAIDPGFQAARDALDAIRRNPREPGGTSQEPLGTPLRPEESDRSLVREPREDR